MARTLRVLLAVVTVVLIWSAIQGGLPLLGAGISNALALARLAIPLIVAAFLVIGLMERLLPGSGLGDLLTARSGLAGILMTSLAGALVPGGPYVFYPLASASFAGQDRADPALFAFVGGKHALDLARLPLEAGFMGTELVLWRNLLTLPYPLVLYLLVRATSRPPVRGDGSAT